MMMMRMTKLRNYYSSVFGVIDLAKLASFSTLLFLVEISCDNFGLIPTHIQYGQQRTTQFSCVYYICRKRIMYWENFWYR